MLNIRTLSQRHAIFFSFVIVCMFLAIYRGLGVVFDFFPLTMTRSFCEETIDILWPAALTILCGYGFSLRMKGFGETLAAGIAFLSLYLAVLLTAFVSALLTPDTQWQPLPGILLGILSMIGIGIREELIFRGIIANALLLKYGKTRKGLWFAIVLSGFFFGIVHIPNFFSGVELIALIAQIIAATGIGILFAAIYLRGGNIWVPVLIHAVIDASGLFASTFTVTAITNTDEMSGMNLGAAFLFLPFLIGLSVYLLRKEKRHAVFARLEALREELHI